AGNANVSRPAGGEKKRAPPVKVLSCQLRTAESQEEAAVSGDVWVVRPARGGSLPVSLVWMQGTVLEAQPDRNTVLLMDETGTFTVQGVNNIPRGKPCLSQGKQVCDGDGGVIQAGPPEPVIRAVKMADLSERAELHRRMWKLEVEELQQLLLA
uniref:RecQ mediated genome instability 2 n=1 Tax=Scophthalmus maximus TaxID=52904 RepID=A0A8D2ZWJ1_SCOMX